MQSIKETLAGGVYISVVIHMVWMLNQKRIKQISKDFYTPQI